MSKIPNVVTNTCDRCGGPAGQGGNYFKAIRQDFREYLLKDKMYFEMCDSCFKEVMKFAERKG